MLAGCATAFGHDAADLGSRPAVPPITATDLAPPASAAMPSRPPALLAAPDRPPAAAPIPPAPPASRPNAQVSEQALLGALLGWSPGKTRALRLAGQGHGAGAAQAATDDQRSAAASTPDSLTLAKGAKASALAGEAARLAESTRLAALSRSVDELRRLQSESTALAPSMTTPPIAEAPAAAGLQPAKIAWNTPPTMALGDSAEVELRITLDERLFPGLASRVQAAGETTAEAAELSRDLTAKLESTAFDVKPEGDLRQMVREGRDAVWRWVISPRDRKSVV